MTRHLLRLIWNRKRQNFLLTVEIFFSFLTLFGVVLFAVQYANNARQPLGYEHRSPVEHQRRSQGAGPGPGREGPPSRDLPAAADRRCARCRRSRSWRRRSPARTPTPTGAAACGWSGGRNVDYGVNSVTDDYLDLLHIPLVAGRWFSREDDAATWKPVVVNRRLAREIFGDANPVGQIIKEERDPERAAARSERQAGGQARRSASSRSSGRTASSSTAEQLLFYRMRLDGPDAEGGAARPRLRPAQARHDRRRSRKRW